MNKQTLRRIKGQLIIDSKAQRAFLLYCLAMIVLVLTIVAAIAFSPLNPLRTGGYPPSLALVLSIWGICFVTLVLAVLAGFFLSNTIFGPLKRLKDHMDSVARGETLNDVRFRKNDYFSEVAESFNNVMEIVREYKKEGPGEKTPVAKQEK